ncbi:MAG: MMPL family transporter [Clostridiaceae bacterium]|nr:MMPL family transporter [Clostridiaceae bacterium]
MLKFGNAVVKYRIPILILAVLLLIPSAFGAVRTRINYDMLDYLPDGIDTVKGQNILTQEFGKGAFSFVIVEGMPDKDVAALKARIEQIGHVDTVLWYDDLFDISVPKEMLPDKYYDIFNSGDATLLAVFFDTSTSADETMEAVTQIRSLAGRQCFVSGLSALVTDLKALCEKEEPVYVGIAVLCACIAMMLLLDSWLVPLVFLLSIGMAILYNLGSNYFMGEVSYITKALAAVLQLAVTMDYSIFLWHSYSEQKQLRSDNREAMAHAIGETVTSVVGSSLTTIAGFIALCFMSYTLGADLGIVMAKGVLLGVIGSITTLPALILLFDRALEKTRHRPILRSMDRPAGFITRHFAAFLLMFAVLLVPATIGYTHTPVYYDFTNILSSSDKKSISQDDMQFLVANTKLSEYFDVSSTHMILCNSDMPAKDAKEMLNRIEQVDGVKYAIGLDSAIGRLVPAEVVPQELTEALKSEQHQLILVNSSYKVSTDECNAQIDEINEILKQYDPDGMLIGEGPCTKDLINITGHDFTVVSWISIAAVFVIIALVLKSASLPVLLVAVIEFAIFINLGIPYYTGFSMPFIAPVCISTIQLGATVDYAILLTTRYRTERFRGKEKREAITTALSASIPSIVVSALGFFAATFGVGLYSNISLISSMCDLMARGAIISMLSVIFIAPAMFMLLDPIICKTSAGFPSAKNHKTEANA